MFVDTEFVKSRLNILEETSHGLRSACAADIQDMNVEMVIGWIILGPIQSHVPSIS